MEYFAHFLQKCASRRGRLLVFDRRRGIFEPIQKVLPLWYEMRIFYRTEHFASTECTFSDNNKHGIINLKQDKDRIQMAADGALIGHRWSVLNGRSSLFGLLGGASPPEPSVLSGRSSLFGLLGGASPPEPKMICKNIHYLHTMKWRNEEGGGFAWEVMNTMTSIMTPPNTTAIDCVER